MNKFLFVAFALFAVVACDSSSEEILEKVKSKHLKKLLKQRKDTVDSGLSELDELCPGVSDKLDNAVLSFLDCAEKVDESLTICQALQTAALNCTEPLVKIVDDCLPAKSKGLPILGVKSFLAATDFLCKQTGESLFELLNPCLWEDSDDEQEGECSDESLEQKFEQIVSTNTIPAKSEVCEIFATVKGCLHKDGAKDCKNEKTRNVALGLLDAIVSPCNDATNQV